MRTHFFKSIRGNTDSLRTFIEDLLVLLSLGPDVHARLLRVLEEAEASVVSERQYRERADKFAEDNGLSSVTAGTALDALRFLVRQLARDEFMSDSAEDLVADLSVAAGASGVQLDGGAQPTFDELLRTIRSGAVEHQRTSRRRRTIAAGVLPSIESFGTTVELRAITENAHRIGMRADDSAPKITGFVPIVSVKLSADSGPGKEFCFQASRAELGALIEELKAAANAMDAAEKLSYTMDIRSKGETDAT